MKPLPKVTSISKLLSANDIGGTDTHQAGILIPKRDDILSFFPSLNKSEKNPRHTLVFLDDSNQRWVFSFIYYNNRLFGGTRNEYRLTRMTKFIKSNNLKVGDELVLSCDDDGIRRVYFKRNTNQTSGKLKLDSGWKVINIKTKTI